MFATFPTTRLSRLAILTVTGATALSVAACGASNNAKPTSANPTSAAPTSSPSASAKGNDWVRGLIDSVSGNTIQVSQRSGTATVDFTPSTEVAELAPAQLTDVTAGSCVSVHPKYTKQTTADAQALTQGKCLAAHGTRDGGGTLQAKAVTVQQADNGSCPELGARHHRH